jgi:hypothetical protein
MSNTVEQRQKKNYLGKRFVEKPLWFLTRADCLLAARGALTGRKQRQTIPARFAAPERRSTISSTKDIDFIESNRQTLNADILHLAWIFSRTRSRGRTSPSREPLF